MSERYKSKYVAETDYGTVFLTCHFLFERASVLHKFDNGVAFGNGRSICNGCGPAGYGAVVPDSILGVCVTECGNIHNWGYQFGSDHEDKKIIDETFKDNMDRIIRRAYESEVAKIEGGSLVTIRKWFAKRRYVARLKLADAIYARAVQVFGKSAFWDKHKVGFDYTDLIIK